MNDHDEHVFSDEEIHTLRLLILEYQRRLDSEQEQKKWWRDIKKSVIIGLLLAFILSCISGLVLLVQLAAPRILELITDAGGTAP